MRTLIVREPFGDYAKGQAIKNPEEIAKVEETHAHHCIVTDVPESFFEPDPTPASQSGTKTSSAASAASAA